MRVRTALKRNEIVAAATLVFREMGFERASMSEIAARLGGSKATLYGYFKSKESLFIAVADAEASAYFEPLLAELSSTHADARTALRRLGEKALQFILQPYAIAGRRMVIAGALQANTGPSFYENGPAKGLKFLAEYLQAFIESGELRAADRWVMAQHLVALLEAELVPRYLYGVEVEQPKPAKIRDAVKRAVEVFVAGYEQRAP